jgi:hypothetical protein
MTTKDYSLLRAFDLEAAKRGEAVCWNDQETWTVKYIGPATSSCVGCFEWVSGPHTGTFETYRDLDLRMAPLCWVKEKPVYKGDALYFLNKSRVASHVSTDSDGDCFLHFNDGSDCWLSGPSPIFNGLVACTWPPPKVKREGYVIVACNSTMPREVAKKMLSNIKHGGELVLARAEWEEVPQ